MSEREWEKIFHLKITTGALLYIVLGRVSRAGVYRPTVTAAPNYMEQARNYIENYKLVISVDLA